MGLSSLNSRLRSLLSQQNPDGGWGHYGGKASWLEPTVYGLFALWEEHRREAERALALVQSWQRADGSFRPSAMIDEPHWSTSLAMLALQSAGKKGGGHEQARNWLLGIQGAEGGWLSALLKRFIEMPADQNEELHGWPWREGTSSWIEPTAHALVALKRAGVKSHNRVEMGEQMILDRRCEDGGWNYGNRRVYQVTLPSYPETTGLALLGLQGRRKELEPAQRRAELFWRAGQRGIGRAWLAIAMQCHGWMDKAEFEAELPIGGDLTLTALEAIAQQQRAIRTHFHIGGQA